MAGFSLRKKIRSTDVITLYYLIITALYMLLFDGFSGVTKAGLLFRTGVIVVMVSIVWLEAWKKSRITYAIHLLYPILLLSFFYGETASVNHFIFKVNLDSSIFDLEQSLFGFQPSIEFSKRFPQKWIGELLYFGYFSLYLMTAAVCLVFIIKKPQIAERIIFIILTSFLIYYLIFIIFPVVGPQYFLQPPLNEMNDTGIFSWAVKQVQYYGEKPTGAMPSSHVGMVLIYLHLSFKNIRWLFWIILPLFILIVLATVYIKAHYAIDVIAGIVSAPVIYIISKALFRLVKVSSN